MTTRPLALVGPGSGMADVDDPDRPVLDAALRGAGVEVDWVAWDDPAVDWSSYRAAWIRGTWDYTDRYPEFLAWADHVDAVGELWNPAAVVRWNSHKSYLLDFAERGVSVVPSVLVPADSPRSVEAVLAEQGWSEAVAKPAVSAGARGTVRLTLGSPANDALIAEARAHGDVLVQPFVAEVATGETSIMVIDGHASHAVRKIPAPGDFRVQFHHGGTEVAHEPTAAERDLAARALDAAGADLLYARVDMVTPEGAVPQLMELELIEPYLFLAVAPEGVVDRVVAAVLARMG
jgi:glutathione synthase/RimK-type ligase-like ATP-grasp enzyme